MSLTTDIVELNAKLDAYHVERQELRSVFLPADCDWEHHPSLVQCAKDLKAKLESAIKDGQSAIASLNEVSKFSTESIAKLAKERDDLKANLSDYPRLEKENNYLRGLIPQLTGKCVHCGLEDMSKCSRGFPGCAWSDDVFCAEEEMLMGLVKERADLKAKLDAAERALAAKDEVLRECLEATLCRSDTLGLRIAQALRLTRPAPDTILPPDNAS